MTITAPSLSLTDIKLFAQDFLDFYHPGATIPIPIEEIAELEMKIHIVAIPDLKKVFNIDAFTNSSFDTITIDDYVFTNYEERTRLTIAHEIGHIILHGNIYKSREIQTIEQYIAFQESIPEIVYSQLERQANSFAGCVLIPRGVLQEKIKDCDRAVERLEAFGELPQNFKVSAEALMIQIKKENISLPTDIFNDETYR